MALSSLCSSDLYCPQRSQVCFVLIFASEVQFSSTKMNGEAAHTQGDFRHWAWGAFKRGKNTGHSPSEHLSVGLHVKIHCIQMSCSIPERLGSSKKCDRDSSVCLLPGFFGITTTNWPPFRLLSLGLVFVWACHNLWPTANDPFSHPDPKACASLFYLGICHLVWKCSSSPKYLTQIFPRNLAMSNNLYLLMQGHCFMAD